MKKFYYPLLFLILGMQPAFTQVTDSFSDNNFTQNPVWTGEDSLYKINLQQQLQVAGKSGLSGESYLSTTINPEKNIEWRFWIRFAFNPSSQNQCRVYLTSDVPNLKETQNAYYLQFGGSTGSTDSISLNRIKSGQKVCLLAGRPGTIGKTSNTLQILLRRDSLGNWQLYSDTSNTAHYLLEGTAYDPIPLTGNYTGVWAKYTSGNVSNIYWDDFYFGAPQLDQQKPILSTYEIMDSTIMQLTFNENIQSGLNTLFLLEPSHITIPYTLSGNLATLKFPNRIPEDSMLQLSISGLLDASNNPLDTVFQFFYHRIKKGEILFSEIMPDPDPPQGLPNAEFIELYNAGRYAIQLKNMKLSDPGFTCSLPEYLLAPSSFVTLCTTKDSNAFKPFGPMVGLSALPTLNNSSDQLKLALPTGELLDTISYDLTWYHNKSKESGGYSIELMNPTLTCKAMDNWQASSGENGGTPGQRNSFWEVNPDIIAPHLIAIETIHPLLIRLRLDEAIVLDQNQLTEITINGIGIQNYSAEPNQPKSLLLSLPDSLQHQQTYVITAKNIFDCSNNSTPQQLSFVYQELRRPKQNELLFTEIYFDENKIGAFPQTEFLELYNTSNYAINLKNYYLGDAVGYSRLPEYVLAPHAYLILCSDQNEQDFKPYGNTLGLAHFPSLNYSDRIYLKDSFAYLIAQVDYREEWFSNSSKVYSCSLELINLDNPCGGAPYWKACINTKGATPGQVNSQIKTGKEKQAPHLNRIFVSSEAELILHFSEPIDSSSFSLASPIFQEDTFSTYTYAYYRGNLQEIQLGLNQNLDSEKQYVMNPISISDCVFNTLKTEASIPIEIPKDAHAGDLFINELLFNPKPNGSDFIELYNPTAHCLNLSKLNLLRITEEGLREQVIPFAKTGWMIYPNEYLCICTNCSDIVSKYPVYAPHAMIESELPAMNDDKGILLLLNEQDELLDSISYSEKMHLSFLNDKEGVSLEKINPRLPGYDPNNWTSAAEAYGFASPCRQNSQYRESAQQGVFETSSPWFSPDGDGQMDVMGFAYTSENLRSLGKLIIYNREGMAVKQVCNSLLLAQKGELSWAGDDAHGNKAPIGVYIACWTVYAEDGSYKQYLRTISLLGK